MPIMSFGDDLDDLLPIFEPDGSISFTMRENVPYCARWPLHGAGQSLVTTSTQIFINASCVKGVTTVQGLH